MQRVHTPVEEEAAAAEVEEVQVAQVAQPARCQHG